MTTAIPISSEAAAIRARRDATGRDLALAHECLGMLIAAVHHRDLPAIRGTLASLQALGARLEASDLARCLDGMSLHTAMDVDTVAQMLPALIEVWECTQYLIVDRAFPPDTLLDNLGALP